MQQIITVSAEGGKTFERKVNEKLAEGYKISSTDVLNNMGSICGNQIIRYIAILVKERN